MPGNLEHTGAHQSVLHDLNQYRDDFLWTCLIRVSFSVS
jgi:hypothetical protein